MLPDFLCIGAQRCGTTWSFENLREHPEIFMPQRKELNFFSEIDGNYTKGLEWYKNHFNNAPKETLKGEITPAYFVDSNDPEKISTTLGIIRIIVILRNPLERAYSSYGKGLREGNWNISFDEFVKTNMDYCIDRGKYYQQLQPYIATFGKKNLLIKIYEDIQTDPFKFIKDIYSFLGVSPDFISSQTDNKFNIGVSNKGPVLSFITLIRDLIYKTPLKNSIKFLQRNSLINKFMRESLSSKKGIIQFSGWMKNEYYDDVKSLSVLLKRDMLLEWKLENE